jgi:hypothetical protein
VCEQTVSSTVPEGGESWPYGALATRCVSSTSSQVSAPSRMIATSRNCSRPRHRQERHRKPACSINSDIDRALAAIGLAT